MGPLGFIFNPLGFFTKNQNHHDSSSCGYLNLKFFSIREAVKKINKEYNEIGTIIRRCDWLSALCYSREPITLSFYN